MHFLKVKFIQQLAFMKKYAYQINHLCVAVDSVLLIVHICTCIRVVSQPICNIIRRTTISFPHKHSSATFVLEVNDIFKEMLGMKKIFLGDACVSCTLFYEDLKPSYSKIRN